MDKVALPFPAFSFTTSVPAFWILTSRATISSSGICFATLSCESRGKIVFPACPPITVMSGTFPMRSCTNLFERTQSNDVMPTTFLGSRPAFSQSADMAGTIEFTGFTMRPITASGQYLAHASTVPLAMSALIVKRSLRSCPGFLGTPAGTSTTWHPVRESAALSIALSLFARLKTVEVTLVAPSTCDKSAATPGTGTAAISRSMIESSLTKGCCAIANDKG
mmetsp:Transcript_16527/g.26218  ORF Transcript_16527/g.26218 Transcript_16527/m.26218 type:complete len:222 (+) Transcript_16527:125-790(+)